MTKNMNFLEKQRIENLKRKINKLLDLGLDNSLFKHTKKALDDALIYNRHTVMAGGLIIESLLSIIYKEVTGDILQKDKQNVKGLSYKINSNTKNKKKIPDNIINMLDLIYNYRNNAAHMIGSKEISVAELMFILDSVLIVLTWYMKAFKDKEVTFSDIDELEREKRYADLFEVAQSDEQIHINERTVLKETQKELDLSSKEVKDIERSIIHNTFLYEQKIHSEDVYEAFELIDNLIKKEVITGEVKIQNIALDMESTWPKIKNIIDKKTYKYNFIYQGLIINPEISKQANIKIKAEWEASIDYQIKNYQLHLKNNAKKLSEQNISLEIKKNNSIPFMHGFLVNEKYLFWSFLNIDENGYIDGGNDFYHYSSNDDKIGRYYIEIYKNWFNHSWKNSDEI